MLNVSTISAAIVTLAVMADYALNVWIAPSLTPYTPLSTITITLLVAPPIVFFLLLQTEKVRRAQHELAREQAARLAAESLNASRSRFLANISHELRTPLNAIIGFSELMQENAEAESRKQDVADHQRVIDGAKRLFSVLNDLLDLAKVEAGKMKLEFAPYDIRAMLQESIELANIEIDQNHNKIVLDIEESLAEGCSDVFRLAQCVRNLLSNAGKFTTDGVITIAARRALQQDEERLVISVKDNGVGMSRDQQGGLFEPFMRVETQTAHADGGSGLGLAITRQLARLLGGDIQVESELGKGSCFTLNVPLYATKNSANPARLIERARTPLARIADAV